MNYKLQIISLIIFPIYISCNSIGSEVSKENKRIEAEVLEKIKEWYGLNSFHYKWEYKSNTIIKSDKSYQNDYLEIFLLKHEMEGNYSFAYENMNVKSLSDSDAKSGYDRAFILITTFLVKEDTSDLTRIEDVYYFHLEGLHNYGTPIPIPIETVIIENFSLGLDRKFKAFWNNDFEYQYNVLREVNK